MITLGHVHTEKVTEQTTESHRYHGNAAVRPTRHVRPFVAADLSELIEPSIEQLVEVCDC